MTPDERTPERDWRRSSYSSDNAACVEVRFASGTVGVRDSKDSGGPLLAFAEPAWSHFVAGLGSAPR
ncbi:DUF397 domain-containing protein [Plantactinospora sp. WMMB334]|uniref:DUF397 domain-containing protein n=1 Tax=Plantactinospora sp. WMMB334 TaxID=3404119 RepID=UPI003B93A5A4